MSEPNDAGRDEDMTIDVRLLVAIGICVFLTGALAGAMLYAFGLAGRQFDLSVMKGGLMTFGVIGLLMAVAITLMTGLLRLLGMAWPRALTLWSEHRLLRRSRRRTMRLLQRRHDLQEERARLTAKMQATYLLEQESARMANQKALTELRTALQGSMVRSCEIVFEHLNDMVDQYQMLIEEIESSVLPSLEKKALLDELSARLNVESQQQKKQSARQVMETAIWEVRFRKARLLATRQPAAAVEYLKKIRGRTESHRILLQLDALVRELEAAPAS